MTKFEKPGRREGWDYPQMAQGVRHQGAGGRWHRLLRGQQGFVGYVAGDSTSGNRALYELGMTGIPIANVNNNCSTGSTALFLAAQSDPRRTGRLRDRAGLREDAARPAPRRRRGPRVHRWASTSRRWPRSTSSHSPWRHGCSAPPDASTCGKFGTTAEHFAKIGYKNHKHSVNNPYAQFQDEYTLDDILAARMISDPLTKLQCSPTSDGSGAAIVASEAFVDKHGLAGQAVEIVGQAMTTDFGSTFDGSAKNLIGYDMNVQAAQQVYDQSGLGPTDFQVIELHDCFSANELLLYEALGLCARG